jgi:hypothetical protein
MKNKHNQSTVISPEEAMSSYFGDLFSEGSQVAPDNDDLLSSSLEFISSASVDPGYCLIPTSDLNDRIVDFSQPQCALVESFTLLLWGLYFLRQPISGKLRTHVLDHCNEMSMEYHLLLDLAYARLATGEGE